MVIRGNTLTITNQPDIFAAYQHPPLPPHTCSVQTLLASLHDQGDLYTQKIEVENRNVKAMDEQIQLLKQKILYQRKHMGGVNAARGLAAGDGPGRRFAARCPVDRTTAARDP